MQNHLKDQTSPYLLQHAENPVDWYPWGEEAFERARQEDKPIFLSIGYSTCHWCHVMAHESFEDAEIAEILNESYIAIKVDKEERPDIDAIYMEVTQALTGSGGWPNNVFLTPEKKPFFAGTYFPKRARFGQPGLMELLLSIAEAWSSDREMLLTSAEEVLAAVQERVQDIPQTGKGWESVQDAGEELLGLAIDQFRRSFDAQCGGFGRAPKFPTPHNLLFLMTYSDVQKDQSVMEMVEKTLIQMYRGGLFDHVGGGFCRYSTDKQFLVPHFEKMLYDNALLMTAYCKAYERTQKNIYRQVAERVAAYLLREMRSENGGFYSAQDADSEGEEGKYYLFTPEENRQVLGAQKGEAFRQRYDITETGNFEGKNIPNLLQNEAYDGAYEEEDTEAVYRYRRSRYSLHLDDKQLTAWNALAIVGFCQLYRITQKEEYLKVAEEVLHFILEELCEEDTLYVSFRAGKRSEKGFLDEYAFTVYALLELYQHTWDSRYWEAVQRFWDKIRREFYDEEQGGFFLYGAENEQLIFRPKPTGDGAMFSGNSAMAYNLVRLQLLTGRDSFRDLAEQQLLYLSQEAKVRPMGYAFAMLALLELVSPPDKVVVVLKSREELEKVREECFVKVPESVFKVLEEPTEEYPLKNGSTTYYVCKGQACLPPTNQLD